MRMRSVGTVLVVLLLAGFTGSGIYRLAGTSPAPKPDLIKTAIVTMRDADYEVRTVDREGGLPVAEKCEDRAGIAPAVQILRVEVSGDDFTVTADTEMLVILGGGHRGEAAPSETVKVDARKLRDRLQAATTGRLASG